MLSNMILEQYSGWSTSYILSYDAFYWTARMRQKLSVNYGDYYGLRLAVVLLTAVGGSGKWLWQGRRIIPGRYQRWGGTLSCGGEGVREFQFQRLEKKLSTLPTLWCCVIPRGGGGGGVLGEAQAIGFCDATQDIRINGRPTKPI